MTFMVAKKGAVAAILALLMLNFSGEADAQRGDLETVKGTVKGFTEAPKGEIDGMALSDGTVVHWPPHLERLFTTIIKPGDRVRVVGFDEIKPKGEQVLVVRSVTNLATKMTRVNEDAPPASAGSELKQ